MKSFFSKSLLVSTLFAPVVSMAAFEGIKEYLLDIGNIFDAVYVLVFALALLYFFWGMGQFILKSGDSKLREEGKQRMIWGIIALFVIFSIFGIITWIGDELGIDQDQQLNVPIL